MVFLHIKNKQITNERNKLITKNLIININNISEIIELKPDLIKIIMNTGNFYIIEDNIDKFLFEISNFLFKVSDIDNTKTNLNMESSLKPPKPKMEIVKEDYNPFKLIFNNIFKKEKK